MRKNFLIGLMSFVILAIPMSLSAQLAARQTSGAQPTFFTENDNIKYVGTSIAGGENGEVTEINVQGNKVVINVLVPALENDPNRPPWVEPEDSNTEMTILFKNNKYYIQHPNMGEVEGTLNNTTDQITLTFYFEEFAYTFVVDK